MFLHQKQFNIQGVVMVVASFLILTLPLLVSAQSVGNDNLDVQLVVQGCNNNNVCEPGSGETVSNCPNDCIAPTPTPSGGGGGGTPTIPPNTILNIAITTDTDSAIISWETTFVTKGTLVWGLTSEYELGSVSEIDYTYSHRVKIENLLPGQKYYFRIDAEDTRERIATAGMIEFLTKGLPDTLAPANVRNLTGTVQGETIVLTWVNPIDSDFDGVKILRSETSYPLDPFQGRLVYEGGGAYFSDANISPGNYYYYTVFAKDLIQNFSSGAVVLVDYRKSPPVISPDIFPETEPPPPATVPEQVKELTLLDFDVSQRGEKISFTDDTIRLDERDNVLLTIDEDKLPVGTKSLVLTLRDPSNPNVKQTFLLQKNEDRNQFEAVIEKFRIGGIYRFDISVVNTLDTVEKKIPGNFVVPRTELPTGGGFEDVPLTETLLPFIILCIFIYLLRRIYLFFRKRKQEQETGQTKY